jgi:nucleoside-diphosphate-sugar epimerase
MRVLVIGGNGFMGPWVVRELKASGHEVAVFHRGTKPFTEAKEIIGDRNRLLDYSAAFDAFAPEVIVDMVLSSPRQAEQLVDEFRTRECRIVAISSMDVYRAAGVLHGTEPGPLQQVPLTEDSELRTKFNVYPPAALKTLRNVFSWLDDEYDKVLVERALRQHAGVPITVLRLPMVYGPEDPLHRLYPLVKRMKDGRKVILLASDFAAWTGPRGYVEDVAHAIALAVLDPHSAGRTYNVAIHAAMTERDWTQAIAKVFGWNGEIVDLPREQIPPHLLQPGNPAQHWAASSKRVRRELGYKETISFEESLRRTIEWELANPPAQIDPKQFDYAAEDQALAEAKQPRNRL